MFDFKCPICGKEKVILDKGIYTYKVNAKYFCSYTCWVKYRKEHQKALAKHYRSIFR